MDPSRRSARQIALCLVDTAWRVESLGECIDPLLDDKAPDAEGLARYLIDRTPDRSPSVERLTDLLLEHERLAIWLRSRPRFTLRPGDQGMQPAPPNLITFPLPNIPNRHHLAQWLGLSDSELDWFTGLGRRDDPHAPEALRHYRYRWIERPGREPRLLEIPKPRLKALQRQILEDLLYRVPIHDAAHGWRPQRSCVSAALPHCDRPVLLRLDLRHFFHAISFPRVRGLFLMLGYPHDVATALAGLCTHRTPTTINARLSPAHRQQLRSRHLPQGAPSSPYLANLCCWRLDSRLAGLARSQGLNYTRYGDDMALSGPRALTRGGEFFSTLVGAIALEEGFELNHRKTRCQTQASRQAFCGVVVNRHPNINRQDFDRLKAILTNCLRHGPDSQNRDRHQDFRAHLAGRIAHIQQLNPQRGLKLRRLWDRIDWGD
ncbi:MAG: reverse transcriptase family protein [Gammaproteobacteria bacterium]